MSEMKPPEMKKEKWGDWFFFLWIGIWTKICLSHSLARLSIGISI